jgi:heat shock protein HslJ
MTNWIHIVALPFALGLPACMSIDPQSAPSAEGRWQILDLDGTPAVAGAVLELEGNTLSATAGCNSMSGAYRIEGAILVAGPLMATRMYCEGRMQQEAALGALLQGRPSLEINAGEMVLMTLVDSEAVGHIAHLRRID